MRCLTLAVGILLAGTAFAQEPLPAPVAVAASPVMTVDEFARSFQPLPGTYEVTLLHPKTCCPVTVCFTIPPCHCVKKVKASKHSIRIEIEHRRDVVINFRHSGKVDVRGT